VNISVQISANAPKNQIVGWQGDRLKIKVKAPAVEGKANAELLRFLGETLKIRPNCLQILRGETAKLKVIRIEGMELPELNEKICQKDS
jgi:uncharacterized protein (TIGR00251 family)